MKEWIVSEKDLGCDGEYMSYEEIVRCKDCKFAYMTYDGECKYCSWGEKRKDD